MKEAFLMGILAMSGQADDNDINLVRVVTPVEVTQNGKTETHLVKRFHYSITGNDTRADSPPHITRIVNTVDKSS